MKYEIPTTKTVNITHIELRLPIRYGTEDIPTDFPLRKRDMWIALVNIDTGEIVGWPKGEDWNTDLYMKVADAGCYMLIDEVGGIVRVLDHDYVPHGVVPGEFGDYVDLKINNDGFITNWPKELDLSEFWPSDD